MTTSKASKKRKGCWVCGDRFIRDHSLPTAEKNTCQSCLGGRKFIDDNWQMYELFTLIVDGSFIPWSGERSHNTPGPGGAGLVLINAKGLVVATKSCGFEAKHSADAEFQAVVRGSRWIPGVTVYTDSKSHADRARGELSRDIRFLRKRDREDYYEMAHALSVVGRQRFYDWHLSQMEKKDDGTGEDRPHQEEPAPART
jgi:ribonuclease HI